MTESWSNLGNGFDSTANAMTFLGNRLIVAGDFLNVDSTPCAHVAVYNFVTSTCENLGQAIPKPNTVRVLVSTISANRNAIYEAEQFDTAGNVAANNIAKWDLITNEWEPLIDYSTAGNTNKRYGFFSSNFKFT